ncbi:MAG: N-acetylglucosaminyltransferase [Sediminibacterium sp.]|nr:N-acetylglucosaminyltransferase [Sediminibacterium sp.]
MYWPVVVITAVLLLAYCLLILIYRHWYLGLPLFQAGNDLQPKTIFSIIIPARNEEDNIRNCLHSILQQNYPAELFEVIVINDHSTDQTESIIRSMQQEYSNLYLLNLTDYLDGKQLNAYKKKAIEIAISQSKGVWIVTTDADCMAGDQWLTLYDAFIQEKQPVFVAAPVMFTDQHSFLSTFQLLDFLSLQGITAAAVSAGHHTMCNGANIAYRKDAFYEVGQFKGIDNLASGDDMLLMHKMKQKYPEGLGYLFSREVIVTTAPMPNWKSFFNQRIRWASKADKYKDKSIFWVLALVYAVNALLLLLLVWGLFEENGIYNWLVLVIAKTIIELSLMIPVAKFYGHVKILLWFPLMQPFHMLYTVIAGWLGKFGTYQWKGRKVH